MYSSLPQPSLSFSPAHYLTPPPNFSVTSHMVADLCVEGDRPTALVLESPFNNIQDEVKLHKLASVSD